jgi:hypothetical protein
MVNKPYSMQRIEIKGRNGPREYLHGIRTLLKEFS